MSNANYGTGYFNYQWYLKGVSVNAYASFGTLYYTFNNQRYNTVEAVATDQVGVSVTAQITFYVS